MVSIRCQARKANSLATSFWAKWCVQKSDYLAAYDSDSFADYESTSRGRQPVSQPMKLGIQ